MLEDTLEMDEDEEVEAEADAEVDKVLFEVTDGKLGQAGKVGTGLPVWHSPLVDRVAHYARQVLETTEEEEAERVEQFRQQLHGLLSS
jgi:charged multivesicular body protein 3